MKIKYIDIVFILIIIFALVIIPSNAKSINKSVNITNISKKLLYLSNKNKELTNKLSILEAEVNKLEIENSKLNYQIKNLESWDARKIMDRMFIYEFTPSGKEYKLMFHVGGMGGVAVYQYVGLFQGDAGKYRQYKQIAELHISNTKSGYIIPGVVLHPIWGFNNSTLVIHSYSDLIRIENKINNINGLTKYFMWLRTRYNHVSTYNTASLVGISLICVFLGTVIGEVMQPIRSFAEYSTSRILTDFGEGHKRNKIKIMQYALPVLSLLLMFVFTKDIGLSILIGFVVYIILFGINKVLP